jgi:hypothetical protein
MAHAVIALPLIVGLHAAAGEGYWSENPVGRLQEAACELTALRLTERPARGCGAPRQALALEMERYDDSPIRKRPEYQKAKLYLGWDPQTLYITAEVYDPEHLNEGDGERIWDGDCVQVALVRGRTWRELAFALTKRGPEAFCWQLKPVPESEFAYIGKGPAKGVRLAVAREPHRTLYDVAIPASEIGAEKLAAEDVLRFNAAVFDRSPEGPKMQDFVVLASGLCGPKFIAPYARLTLVETPREMTSVAASRASLLPNPSFEEGEGTPAGWMPRSQKGGTTEWANTEASSGSRCLKFTLTAQPDSAAWELGKFTGLKPNTPYTISARSRGNGKANFFRLRFYVGGKTHLVGLSAAPEWRKTSYTFTTGDAAEGWLTIESCNWQGEGLSETYADDLILQEGLGIEDTKLDRREVAFLTDDLASPVVMVFKALYPRRIRFFELGPGLDWKEVEAFEKLVLLPKGDVKLDWDRLKAFVASGKTAVLDLAAYAAMTRRRMVAQALPAGEAEETPVPLAIVERDHELSAGYPKGSEVPWFGRMRMRKGDELIQRYLPEPGDATVVARSGAGGAVWLAEKLGKGMLFALDVALLDEPTLTWRDRGSYNKYAPIQNALGHGLRFGRYFNRRMKYYDYLELLKALPKQHPALTLTVEGFAHGYNRFGLCIGNPKGPVYVYTGMPHAQGEYQSGLYGLYAFAEYLGKHAGESPLKERLAKIAVKIVPVVCPELYITGTADKFEQFRGKEQPLPVSNWAGEVDDVKLTIEQHHGMGPLQVGFGYSFRRGDAWARAIFKHATEVLYATAPSAYWDVNDQANTGAQAINRVSAVGPNPPSWDGYFEQWPHFGGLAATRAEKLHQAHLNILAEHTIYGRSPAFNDFSVPIREHTSALMTDQSVTFLLASLLVDEPEAGR